MNIKYLPEGTYKSIFVSDMHKRDVDFSTILDYRKATTQTQLDLLRFIREQGINLFISMGDWYDKGYRKISSNSSDKNIDQDFSAAVGGNAFLCLGNHVFLERDANPEYYLIQPNKDYPTLEPFYATEPIFQAVDILVVGSVQIDLFHFSKLDKNYVHPRLDGITYRIGVYHDDCVVPSNIRKAAGYMGTTSSEYLTHIYEDMDLAMIGHIHTPIGIDRLHLDNGKEIPLFIPGSMAPTKNSDIEKHKSTQLPVLTFTPGEKPKASLVTFSTHMEMMKFYNKKEHKKSVAEKESAIFNGVESQVQLSDVPQTVSLRDYFERRGADKRVFKYLDTVTGGTASSEAVLMLLDEQ